MGHEGALRAALRALTCESCTLTGGLLFWAEVQPDGATERSSPKHPFCADAGTLRCLLGESGAKAEKFTLLLPGNSRRPIPSPQLPGADRYRRGRRALRAWEIQGLRPARAVEVLVRLLEPDSLPPDVRLGDSLRYWQRASQLALEALAGQQTIPGLKHRDDGLYARWLPLLDNQRLERLAGAMPPVRRADPKGAPAPRALLEDFLEETCDALVREWSSPPEPLKEPSEPGSRWARAREVIPQPPQGTRLPA